MAAAMVDVVSRSGDGRPAPCLLLSERVRLEVRVPKEDPVAVVLKTKEIMTEPLDVGEGKLSLVDVIAQAEGAPVSAGICEFSPDRGQPSGR
jgi:hypothetical protein